MTYRTMLLFGALMVGILAPPALAQQSDQPAVPQARAAQPADQIGSAIDAIRQAGDPSAAVAAYARGATTDPNDPQLLSAYVEKMATFGLPDVAYLQAQRLVDIDPSNGLAWAVMSYMAARQGQMAEALADLAQAGNRAPDRRFVQETAGQLLAWYDKNKPAVSDSLQNSLEKVRQAMTGQKAYVSAYRDAQQDLKQAGTQQNRPQSAQRGYGTAQTSTSTQNSYWPAPENIFPDQYSYTPFPEDYSGLYGDSGPGYATGSGLGYDYYPSYLSYGYGYYPSYPYGSYYPGYVSSWYGWGAGWGWGWGYWPYGRSCRNNIFVFGHDFDHHHNGDHRYSLTDLLRNNRHFNSNNGLHDSHTFAYNNTRFAGGTSAAADSRLFGASSLRSSTLTRNGLAQRNATAGSLHFNTDRSTHIFRGGTQQGRLTFNQPYSSRTGRSGYAAGNGFSTLQRSATGLGTPRGGSINSPTMPQAASSGQMWTGSRIASAPYSGYGMGGSIGRSATPQMVAPQSFSSGGSSVGHMPSMSVPHYSAPSTPVMPSPGIGAAAPRSFSGSPNMGASRGGFSGGGSGGVGMRAGGGFGGGHR